MINSYNIWPGNLVRLLFFTSQLLCEQVVGRGLRRTTYEVDLTTGFFEAEYVNVFGVPFTFLPHEGGGGTPPPPPKPKTQIEPVKEKQAYEISWPNIIRVDHVYNPKLVVDVSKMPTLTLNAYDTITLAELAPVVEGKPDLSKIAPIDLEELAKKYRMQKIIFETARDAFDNIQNDWKGNRESLIGQLIRIVEEILYADVIQINPPLFDNDELRRRILLTLNMGKIVNHIIRYVRSENTQSVTPVFDIEKPIRSTADMRTWYTSKPCEKTKKSHINFCVLDSTWESTEAFQLDNASPMVDAWVKNDHLGFEISYTYQGIVHKYRPDYIVRTKNNEYFIVEVKGQITEQDKTKIAYMKEWIKAVNEYGGFGIWDVKVVSDFSKVFA